MVVVEMILPMLDKAIEHGHEHRKPYIGAKSVDKTCRNHGSDSWERDNRLFFDTKPRMAADEELNSYENE